MSPDFILFRGCKRSGNHLVLNWIRMMSGDCLFYNEMTILERNYEEVAHERLREIAPWSYGHRLVMLSVEYPEWIGDLAGIERYARQIVNSSRVSFPVLLRDPLNWFASHMHIRPLQEGETWADRYELMCPDYWDLWRRNWAIYHKAPFQVNFNQFVQDEFYRTTFCQQLGLDFDTAIDAEALNTLWTHPGVPRERRSSFDTAAIDSGNMAPSSMPVLERHKTLSGFDVPDDMISIGSNYWGVDFE